MFWELCQGHLYKAKEATYSLHPQMVPCLEVVKSNQIICLSLLSPKLSAPTRAWDIRGSWQIKIYSKLYYLAQQYINIYESLPFSVGLGY